MCKVYARVCGLLIAHLHLLPTYRCIDFNELRLTNKSLKILMQPLALILYFVFLFSYFFYLTTTLAERIAFAKMAAARS